MSKLILPKSIEFPEYKGFVIKVDEVDGIYVGLAKDREGVEFRAKGNTRNEVGKKLEGYVDIYRKSQKQKLVLN